MVWIVERGKEVCTARRVHGLLGFSGIYKLTKNCTWLLLHVRCRAS